MTVDVWGYLHRLKQATTALTKLTDADVTDLSISDSVAALKAMVAKLTKETADATALIRKCDLTRKSHPRLVTLQELAPVKY